MEAVPLGHCLSFRRLLESVCSSTPLTYARRDFPPSLRSSLSLSLSARSPAMNTLKCKYAYIRKQNIFHPKSRQIERQLWIFHIRCPVLAKIYNISNDKTTCICCMIQQSVPSALTLGHICKGHVHISHNTCSSSSSRSSITLLPSGKSSRD